MRKGLVLAVISLLAIILISGCTSNTKPVVGKGVVVNEFSADPKVAQPDDTVTFYLDIENAGDVTAHNVGAVLYGLEGWNDINGNPISGPYTLSGLNSYVSQNSIEFYWTDNQGHTIRGGYDWDRERGYLDAIWNNFRIVIGNYYHDLFSSVIGAWGDLELRPAIPEKNIPAQFQTKQWTFYPPILPEGVKQTYKVTARVYYDYKTTGTINIPVYSSAEWERRQNSGKTADTILSSNSAGPIQLNIIKATSPIIVNEKRAGYEKPTFTLQFQNVGDGWPLVIDRLGQESTSLLLGTIKVDGPGVIFDDCLGQTGGNIIYVDPNLYPEVNILKLRSDGKLPFQCTLAIDRSVFASQPMATITLSFDFRYYYYTDATTDVTVIGESEFSSIPNRD